jgi:hypothetical protein
MKGTRKSRDDPIVKDLRIRKYFETVGRHSARPVEGRPTAGSGKLGAPHASQKALHVTPVCMSRDGDRR